METLLENKAAGGKAYFIGQDEPVLLWPWLNDLFEQLNLPALKKVSSHCLKGPNTIHVHKEKVKPNGGTKIFIKCKDGGMPPPCHLLKDGGKWYWTNV